jgi:hypothetical protein
MDYYIDLDIQKHVDPVNVPSTWFKLVCTRAEYDSNLSILVKYQLLIIYSLSHRLVAYSISASMV